MVSPVGGVGGAAWANRVQSMAGSEGSMASALNGLFSQIDPNRTGEVSREQFDLAVRSSTNPQVAQQITSDQLFSKLDPEGTGTISREDFVQGMKQLLGKTRTGRVAFAPSQSGGGKGKGAAASTTNSPPSSVNRPTPGGPTGSLVNLFA